MLAGDFSTDNQGDSIVAQKQKTLNEDWVDKVPPEVQEAADNYVAAMNRKASATEKFNGAKTALIEVMQSKKCNKVKVQYKDGEKILELSEIEKLKLRKPEAAPTDDDDE